MVFAMTRLRTIHVCTECTMSTPKWAGRCPSCGAWNSLVEDVEEVGGPALAAVPSWSAGGAADVPLPIADVDSTESAPQPTGIGELDRVLGGGLVPGSVTLLGGEPGVGKSTLLLQVMTSVASRGRRALLVSAEESKQQVRLRAERLGPLATGLWL